MKSIALLETIEKVLKHEEITEEEYKKSAGIVESILVNNNIKHLYKEEVLNQLLMKLIDSNYDFSLCTYQKRNYIVKYLIKAMQEVVQIGNNIVDIPLYVIEKGIVYTDETYEEHPENYFAEDFHENIEQDLLMEHLYSIVTPKEKYVLQRGYIDGVFKKDIAKELKLTPINISMIMNKIKKKALSIGRNQY